MLNLILIYLIVGIIMCIVCPIIGFIMTALFVGAVAVTGCIMAYNWEKD